MSDSIKNVMKFVRNINGNNLLIHRKGLSNWLKSIPD